METILTYKDFSCPRCFSTKSEIFVSVTKSTYEYCNKCKYNLDKVLKEKYLDIVFENVIQYIKNNRASTFKIEIIEKNNTLNLLINEQNLVSSEINFTLSTKDIYFLENTLYELIQDLQIDYRFGFDIIVCP